MTAESPASFTSLPSRPNIVVNFEHDLNAYLDLVRAHALVHPDRDKCGGVGRCLMMRTETQAEQEIVDIYLRSIAVADLHLTIASAGSEQ